MALEGLLLRGGKTGMEVLPGYRRAWTVFYARAKQALME